MNQKLITALNNLFFQFRVDLDSELGKRQYAAYFEILSKRSDIDVICECVERSRWSSKFLPSVAEILSPIHEAEESATERQWLEFKQRFERECTNNKTFERDVFTVMKHIGFERINHATPNDWVWIWKEVRDLWERLITGDLDIQQSPREHRLGSQALLNNGAGKSVMSLREWVKQNENLIPQKLRVSHGANSL